MARESVNETRDRTEDKLHKAQAILNLLMVAQDVDQRSTSNAAWAASDFIEEALPGGARAAAPWREDAENNLHKAQAITNVLMVATKADSLSAYNAARAVSDLIQEAREGYQATLGART